MISKLANLKVVKETPFSDGERAKVVATVLMMYREGVAIMIKEGVDVSIFAGNSTNPIPFPTPL